MKMSTSGSAMSAKPAPTRLGRRNGNLLGGGGGGGRGGRVQAFDRGRLIEPSTSTTTSAGVGTTMSTRSYSFHGIPYRGYS